MDYQEFYKWKDLKSEVALRKYAGRPHLSDMVQNEASRGNFVLYYKTSYMEDFKKLHFLCKKAAKKAGFYQPMLQAKANFVDSRH